MTVTPPALLSGESPAEHDVLADQVWSALLPKDAIEEILGQDIVYPIFESQRLRRIKIAILRDAGSAGLIEILLNRIPGCVLLAHAFRKGDPEARRRVAATLEAIGETTEAVQVQAFRLKLDEMERFDRLIANADARRNALLREFDRRRDVRARRLRGIAEQDVEDAEFVDLYKGEGAHDV